MKKWIRIGALMMALCLLMASFSCAAAEDMPINQAAKEQNFLDVYGHEMLIWVGFLSIIYAGMSGFLLTTVSAAYRTWLSLAVPFLLVGGSHCRKKWGTECTTGTVRGLDRADTTKKGKLPVE